MMGLGWQEIIVLLIIVGIPLVSIAGLVALIVLIVKMTNRNR